MEEFYQNIIVLTLLSLISVIIIVGNGLVILAWITQRSLRTPSNAYITSLAFCDLLVGLIVAPADIGYQLKAPWFANQSVCQLRIVSLICFCTVSIFHLIAIALDRYRTVIEGVPYIQRRSMKSVIEVVIILWIISIWISLPPVMSDHNPHCYTDKVDKFQPHLGFAFHVVFGGFIFPTFLMITLYSRVYSEIQKRLNLKKGSGSGSTNSKNHASETDETTDNKTDSNNTSSSNTASDSPGICKNIIRSSASSINLNRVSECRFEPRSMIQSVKNKLLKISLTKEKKSARTLGIIIGAFLICWFPAFSFIVVGEIFPQVLQYRSLFRIFAAIGYANSGVNPIVYSIYNKDFRRAFKRILGITNRSR